MPPLLYRSYRNEFLPPEIRQYSRESAHCHAVSTTYMMNTGLYAAPGPAPPTPAASTQLGGAADRDEVVTCVLHHNLLSHTPKLSSFAIPYTAVLETASRRKTSQWRTGGSASLSSQLYVTGMRVYPIVLPFRIAPYSSTFKTIA